MKNFNNPLDNIHIASPCSADWSEMYGDNRKRFCGDCKLNVYNLSDPSGSRKPFDQFRGPFMRAIFSPCGRNCFN